MKVAVVGLGKLGCPLAAWLATRHEVVGIDLDGETVAKVNAGLAPVEEPGLPELMGRFRASTDYAEASGAGMAFVIVPTPSLPDGSFSLAHVRAALDGLRPCYRGPLVVTSTVMPGHMDTLRWDGPLLYNPWFVALGGVLDGFRHPPLVLVGERDPADGRLLATFWREMGVAAKVRRLTFMEAELAKLALNCYVVMKMSFANFLGELGDALGADARAVAEAVGLDPRVGSSYFQPGAPYGGPCLPPQSLVQTSLGLKRIDQIFIGDEVLSHDGQYHPVTKVYKRPYKGMLVQIIAKGYPNFLLQCTPEHPIWARRRVSVGGKRWRTISTTGEYRLSNAREFSELTFISANELKVGDLLCMPIPAWPVIQPEPVRLRTHRLSNVKPETKLTPDIMRLFGFYLSEGHTWKKEICFSLHKSEQAYFEFIRHVLDEHFGSKAKIHRRQGNGIRIRAACSPLADYLRETFGHGAGGKRIPYEWLQLPEPLLIGLLQGIWYGDGSNSGNRLTWATISRDMFNFVRFALLRLGIAHTTKVYKKRQGSDGVWHQEVYFLTIASPFYIDKASKVFPALALETSGKLKKDVWIEEQVLNYHIRSVEQQSFDGYVYNLEVKDSESYVLENCVVHNCFPRDARAMATAARAAHVVPRLPEAAHLTNEWQRHRLLDEALRTGARSFAVLGLAYKPGTPVTEESAGAALAEELRLLGREVLRHDPAAEPGDAQALVDRADAVVVATPWPEYRELDYRGKPVVDPWGVAA